MSDPKTTTLDAQRDAMIAALQDVIARLHAGDDWWGTAKAKSTHSTSGTTKTTRIKVEVTEWLGLEREDDSED